MRHLAGLGAHAASLFAVAPREIHRHDVDLVGMGAALGATLYTPASASGLADRLVALGRSGLVASIVCLEDSVPESAVRAAVDNLVRELARLVERSDDHPWLFLRVRNPAMVREIFDRLNASRAVLDGLVLPKFSAGTAEAWLDALDRADRSVPILPVLESPELLDPIRRRRELETVRDALDDRRVVTVRVGGSDLSGHLGVRRPSGLCIHDLGPIADAVSAVIGAFAIEDRFVVSGPVWEHLGVAGSAAMRTLVNETQRGLSVGLLGKSVIHPCHVAVVDACHVVTAEEHRDALDVLAGPGGAWLSPAANKMNEAGPHLRWAVRTLRRSADFGVLADGVTVDDLLVAISERPT